MSEKECMMVKIKIHDLTEDQKVSQEEMVKIIGGVEPTTFPTYSPFYNLIGGGRFSWSPVSFPSKILGITGVPGDFTG